jgi:FkbM family methyltransferase
MGSIRVTRFRASIGHSLRRSLRWALVKVLGVLPSWLLSSASRLSLEALGASRDTSFPACFALSYEATRFDLYVVEGAPWAHRVYSRWADGTEVFELVMLECLTRLLGQAQRPVFMDVGAFMGHYACYAAALLGDTEDVYAVESNPHYHACILRSIELNGFSRVKVFNAVLSDTVEAAAIEGQTVRLFDDSGETNQTVTLDELCGREGISPSVIKIDVHGSEGKVLMGAREVIGRSAEYILLELHPRQTLREYSAEIDWHDILALFWQLGFHVFQIAGHRYRGSGDLRCSIARSMCSFCAARRRSSNGS